MKEKIKLAVQKNGRLNSESLQLIRDCGITFPGVNGRLKTECDNFPIELLFLRDDDIPECVSEGIADIGIAGKNIITEKRLNVTSITDLGFSKCRLSIAVEKKSNFVMPQDLEGKKIATSHPNILGDYLEKSGVNAEIISIRGSVEIAPAIGLADAICDLVSSGSTLLSNGLKEVATIMNSSALLISNNKLTSKKRDILAGFLSRLNSVLLSKEYKYILLNAPESTINQIEKLIPGMKSPTIMPLKCGDWVSLHSVVEESRFWSIIEKIRTLGAEGILVMNVEKMFL